MATIEELLQAYVANDGIDPTMADPSVLGFHHSQAAMGTQMAGAMGANPLSSMSNINYQNDSLRKPF